MKNYKRLSSLKKYCQKGGEVIGEGAFGSVRTLKSNNNRNNDMLIGASIINLYFYKDIKPTKLYLNYFINIYNRLIVFKEFKNDINNNNFNEEYNKIKMLLKLKPELIKKTIIYKDTDYEKYLTHFQLNGKKYMIYKRMDCDSKVFFEKLPLNRILFKEYRDKFISESLSFIKELNKKGLYHNDIKPENIMVEKDLTGSPKFYVGDFGLLNNTFQISGGTPRYMMQTIAERFGFLFSNIINDLNEYDINIKKIYTKLNELININQHNDLNISHRDIYSLSVSYYMVSYYFYNKKELNSAPLSNNSTAFSSTNNGYVSRPNYKIKSIFNLTFKGNELNFNNRKQFSLNNTYNNTKQFSLNNTYNNTKQFSLNNTYNNTKLFSFNNTYKEKDEQKFPEKL
jgi:serine/threonine protein kinase